jgi:hypothetical protein
MTPITGEISLFLELDFKEKRVTISDYSLVDNSFEISNISLTPKDLIDTHHIMTLIMKS